MSNKEKIFNKEDIKLALTITSFICSNLAAVVALTFTIPTVIASQGFCYTTFLISTIWVCYLFVIGNYNFKVIKDMLKCKK